MMLSGSAEIKIATTDIKQALSFSKNVIMVCPSFAQEIFFKDMLPCLTSEHKIVIMPGNYGGLVVNGGIKMLFYGGLKMLFFGGNKCLLLADRFFI